MTELIGSFYVDVGRLQIGAFRSLLEQLQFQGFNIKWHEGSGWLEHRFTIKCTQAAYDIILDAIERYNGRT